MLSASIVELLVKWIRYRHWLDTSSICEWPRPECWWNLLEGHWRRPPNGGKRRRWTCGLHLALAQYAESSGVLEIHCRRRDTRSMGWYHWDHLAQRPNCKGAIEGWKHRFWTNFSSSHPCFPFFILDLSHFIRIWFRSSMLTFLRISQSSATFYKQIKNQKWTMLFTKLIWHPNYLSSIPIHNSIRAHGQSSRHLPRNSGNR
jgi:hypothetical protein